MLAENQRAELLFQPLLGINGRSDRLFGLLTVLGLLVSTPLRNQRPFRPNSASMQFYSMTGFNPS